MDCTRWSSVRGAALIAAAVALSPFILAEANAHGPTPHGPASAGPAPATVTSRNPWGAGYFPNVELTTQHGKKVRFYEDLLKGKTVAINVIFTECTEVCPLETANMVKLRRQLGDRVDKDIVFYSISIDPKNDTPQVLKGYAEKFGADWMFLTGDAADIYQVVKKLGLIKGRDLSSGGHHAAQLMIGNEPTGQWTRTSAVDNPAFLAGRIGSLLGWRNDKPAKSYADASPVTVVNGQRLFDSKCGTCHSIGKGDRLGPDLAAVTARRDRAWLARYIQAPDEMLAAGDAVATSLLAKYNNVRMPNLRLAASDVSDLISYLESRAPAAVQRTSARP
jgi:protein SCO1/2